jgi:hypothetical protein
MKTKRSIVGGALGLFSVIFLIGSLSADEATDKFKGAFKKGCEGGGNSFVENASDNSFSCNLKDGRTIRCTDAHTPCSLTRRVPIRRALKLIAAPSESGMINRRGGRYKG